jgi:hypothetical protein
LYLCESYSSFGGGMTKECTLPIFNPLVFKEWIASFLE